MATDVFIQPGFEKLKRRSLVRNELTGNVHEVKAVTVDERTGDPTFYLSHRDGNSVELSTLTRETWERSSWTVMP